MASPFKKKSPLNAYKYSLTSEYANPKRVIQPIVEADAAKAIGDASKKVLGVYSKVEADKLAKTASDEAGDLKHQRAMEVKWGKGNTGPAVKPASHEEKMSNFGLTSFKDVQAERDAKDFMNRDFGGNKDSNSLVDIGRAGRTSNSSRGSNKNRPQTFKGGIETGKNIGYIPNKEEVVEPERRSVAMMKGSPVKHNAGAVGSIGNANPLAGGIAGIAQAASQGGSGVGSINREGILAADTSVDASLPPPNQVAETGSYGGGGDRILEMNSNPVGNQSIGRNTDITSQLFGSGQRASMLAMKGTPLHTKGHGGAEGHTHAEPDEYLDQTVAENKGVNDIENYKPIQKFKEKQIVVNPSTNDTIFSTNSTFEIPKAMEGIKRSTEGTPEYKPVYINKKSN